jgi:hypothetical protein
VGVAGRTANVLQGRTIVGAGGRATDAASPVHQQLGGLLDNKASDFLPTPQHLVEQLHGPRLLPNLCVCAPTLQHPLQVKEWVARINASLQLCYDRCACAVLKTRCQTR